MKIGLSVGIASDISMSSPEQPSTPFEGYQLSSRAIFICVLLSIIIHFLILFGAAKYRPFADKEDFVQPHEIEVTLAPKIQDTVETLQKTAPVAPDDARFASDRNLKTDEETSPERAPTSMPKIGARPQQAEKRAAQKKQGIGEKKTFSISQKDLLAEGAIQEETLRPTAQGIDSTGFERRLKRGEELKVNAREFDYGNYILRMKNKLIQQWDPNKTFNAQMMSYNEIRVDIGVVLNRAGEIIELRTLNQSMFGPYDQEALRALKESGPFPNPPKSLIQDDGFVYMPWTFTFSIRQFGGGHVE